MKTQNRIKNLKGFRKASKIMNQPEWYKTMTPEDAIRLYKDVYLLRGQTHKPKTKRQVDNFLDSLIVFLPYWDKINDEPITRHGEAKTQACKLI